MEVLRPVDTDENILWVTCPTNMPFSSESGVQAVLIWIENKEICWDKRNNFYSWQHLAINHEINHQLSVSIIHL